MGTVIVFLICMLLAFGAGVVCTLRYTRKGSHGASSIAHFGESNESSAQDLKAVAEYQRRSEEQYPNPRPSKADYL